jgi:hypothetical protein
MRNDPVTSRPALLATIGCVALAVGMLVYVSDRPSSNLALLGPHLPAVSRGLFGAVGLWLPSLVHVFAFSLFSAALLPSRATLQYGACGAWFAINLAFEVGQHRAFKPLWGELLRTGAGDGPIARAVLTYLLRGTFDPSDVLAALFGALAAAALLHQAHHRPETIHATP